MNLLQCQERYTYVVTRENDKRAEEKHPEADGGEELPTFVWAICLNHDNFRIVIEVD